MRLVRYNVAASLDGYVAGPHGNFDWIPDDAAIDFAGIFASHEPEGQGAGARRPAAGGAALSKPVKSFREKKPDDFCDRHHC